MIEKNNNVPKMKKIADLGNNLSIWRVHIDLLREQDKNARVMPVEKFKRLSANISKDHRLESLPLVTPIIKDDIIKGFSIISGHHRTRAARKVGVLYIYVLSLDEKLTHDQIRAKQLAHNALSGFDDLDILNELYNEIEDIDQKLASGVTNMDLQIDAPIISAGDIEVGFDFETLSILFLPKQANKFEEILSMIEPESKLYLADKADFERIRTQIQEISKRENVRNISAIMSRMLDIVEKYHLDNPVVVGTEENFICGKCEQEKMKSEGRLSKDAQIIPAHFRTCPKRKNVKNNNVKGKKKKTD